MVYGTFTINIESVNIYNKEQYVILTIVRRFKSAIECIIPSMPV